MKPASRIGRLATCSSRAKSARAARMKNWISKTGAVVAALILSLTFFGGAATFPGTNWEGRTPAGVGLDKSKLDAISSYMGGRGCIVRHGYLVYTWGDFTTPGDVASAAKPWYSTFLFKAVEDGRLRSEEH